MADSSPLSGSVALLGLIQEGIPFVERPFRELGERCGLSEDEVMATLRQWKADRVVRQVSAIFDTRSLGYASSLVAAKVPEDRLERAVAEINGHPGVSHNYLRNHEFNVWYTVAVPPTSRLGLEGTVECLHRTSGAESTRLLPTLNLFKIGVRFDTEGRGQATDREHPKYSEANRQAVEPLTDDEILAVRHLQEDLDLVPEPFVEMAKLLGCSFSKLCDMQSAFLASGRERRFAAVLHHRRAGFGANAMGVWAGPQGDPEALRRMGEEMASFRAVSHCYERPSYPDWPFNLFTMVHGKSAEDCEKVLAAIAEATGIVHRQSLFSTKEFKKVRVRYFTDAEIRWEADRL
ncbi:DNA-binding Lrp family transcriptional regulator [Haloferula luteola]|uniref:siroheme decarboxylase n=1 Tax=Haloferula luteola TaxID=595692 RepID=A0A840V1H9_9BACT|nr:Lrp/AsnC family transcriptional regulator [Haloferula luteola]MBB5351253.1 DNA-binding Lrp family transcriptional regulator [Haloferula luteola]